MYTAIVEGRGVDQGCSAGLSHICYRLIDTASGGYRKQDRDMCLKQA